LSIQIKHEAARKSYQPDVKSAVGFRNIVVHSYLEVDLEKAHTFIRNELVDFDLYTQAIYEYLKKSDTTY